MSPFDDISSVKEDNIYFRYEVPSVKGELEVKTLTYGQVDLITTNLACELYTKLGKEPIVSVLEDHSVNYPILLYALYKLRVPVQMISIRNTPTTVCSLLNEAGSQCLVYGSSYLQVKETISKEIVGVRCFPVPELNLEELSNSPLNSKWDQILNQNFTEEDIEKTVAIIHSSGTTNTPKIVVWSNRFMIYFIQSLPNTFYKRKKFDFMEDENDILFGITPSFHMFGSYTNHQCILSDGDKHSYLEHFDGDKYQIIIKKGSPFRATGVANRENGDYATNDLVTHSKTVINGYYYAGRTDDTLALITGEKINPSTMEDVIRSSPIVSNCTIIGEGQKCTATLIELNFEAIKDYCPDTVMEKVYEIVRKANEISPSRSAIILPEMIIVIPFSKHLIASDKGTVSRNRSITYFQKEVNAMYAKLFERSVAKLDIKTPL
ncbi:hypothetical protein INT48_002214 [Thamnidium elegans]|uniref:AMP-dependent synthetase/ligase domain-containing protein n=1 Tax=Thamnidium elegans TaxID=101142 RepID=A0A8H7W470_9FUNG|nr:hypothetical protein INT48_002214 [Thamnidium elegans]